MKTKIPGFTFFLLLSVLALSLPVRGAVADDVSCIKCHADASVMKSLFKAPATGGGEGEG
jgi:hypothetical protein